MLMSDKIDFKTKAIKKDKEGHYLMVKGSIQEEDITIINIYAPNTRAPRYLQQILTDIKWEINGNKIIVGDFNTPLTTMDRSSRQKNQQGNRDPKRHRLNWYFQDIHLKKPRIYFLFKCTWNILKDQSHTGAQN